MKKPSNELVSEFEALTAQIKLMEKRREQLSTEFKNYGPFSTTEFVVSIAERTREAMVGADKAAEALNKDKEQLKAMGLISVSKFNVIQVSRKQ